MWKHTSVSIPLLLSWLRGCEYALFTFFQGTSSFLGTKFVILPFMDTFFFPPSGVSMMTHWAFCGLKMNNSHQTLRDLRNSIQVSQTLFHAFYHPHPHPRYLLYWPISSKAASITAAPFSMVAIRMSWPGQSTNDTCLKNKETLNFGQELFLLFLRLKTFPAIAYLHQLIPFLLSFCFSI